MMNKLLKLPYQWNPAIRASIYLLPMVLAYITHHDSLIVPLGQGGFFYSTLPLPQKRIEKIVYMFLIVGVGLGFYLLGGTVSVHPWISIFITFIVAVTIGLLSGGKLIAPLAFSLITVYTAGLNVSSPDKLQTNFLGFTSIFIFCGLLALLPFWKATDSSKVKALRQEDNLKAGTKLGIGAAIALFIANLFDFAKLGWPVSAVGSIIRFNETESKKRALSRVVGTVGGAIVAMIFFFIFTTPSAFIFLAYFFGFLNALMSKTFLGKTVFFYTITILILYSMGDLSMGPLMSVQRIFYNLVGVLVAVFVVLYPFPKLMRRLDILVKDYYKK